MQRTLAILAGLLLLCVGAAYVYFTPEPIAEVPPSPVLNTEVKEMIRFMNPAITEEIANKYLEELQKLNEEYGYKPGGTPKGDIETMQAYGAAVEVLQQKYNISPVQASETPLETAGAMKTPTLAPATTDTKYVPPSDVAGAGTSTSSPPLQQTQNATVKGPAAANPNSSASHGGTASTPPLIQQDSIPPAPTVPAGMFIE
jgi:hypothetical protein